MEESTLSPFENVTDYEYDYDFKFKDYNQRIVIATAFSVAALLGIFGNSLVIFAVFASTKLRTPTNAFVVNLSIADLITSLMIPWNVVILLSTEEYPIKEWGCAFVAGILFTCIGASLFTLASIALNRLMLITRPIRTYKIIYSQFYTGIWIAATWIIPFCFNVIPPLAGIGELGTSQKYRMCVAKSSNPYKDTYDYISTVGSFPIPLLTLIISYALIYKHLRRHSDSLIQSTSQPLNSAVDNDTLMLSESDIGTLPNGSTLQNGTLQSNVSGTLQSNASGTLQSNIGTLPGSSSDRGLRFSSDTVISSNGSRDRRNRNRRVSSIEQITRRTNNTITKNMFLVFVAFLICFVPTVLTQLIDEPFVKHGVPYAIAFLLINACVNPVIYGVKHPYFNNVFKCLLICRWRDIPEQSDEFRKLRHCYCRCI